jgi:hypothetical protein
MIILKNFDFAKKYFDFESKIEYEEIANPKIHGWYKFINEIFTALLVKDNDLHFLYGDNKILIQDNYKVLLNTTNNPLEKKFTILNTEEPLFSFYYPLPNPQFSSSPFEYIDDEDFKWGDFIEKIVNNQDRRRGFIAIMMENSQ